jgi:hypothetical protein
MFLILKIRISLGLKLSCKSALDLFISLLMPPTKLFFWELSFNYSICGKPMTLKNPSRMIDLIIHPISTMLKILVKVWRARRPIETIVCLCGSANLLSWFVFAGRMLTAWSKRPVFFLSRSLPKPYLKILLVLVNVPPC